MTVHSSMASVEVHEPKHITDATTGDAGKVLTPSSTASGTSTLRRLVETEVSQVVDVYTMTIADVSTASSVLFAPGKGGNVTNIQVCLSGAVTTANAAVSITIDGVAVTNGTVTVDYTTSAVGAIYTAEPTAANSVSSSSYITVTTDGGSTTASAALVTITIQRT